MTDTILQNEKIHEINVELKQLGLWKNEIPAWVNQFDKRNINTQNDFTEWLQFVYLPNKVQGTKLNQAVIEKNYIVPQAVKFFGSDIQKGKLLQLLIELDSL